MEILATSAKSTWRFIRRHRNVIGIGAAVGVGVFAAYRIRQAIKEAEESQLAMQKESFRTNLKMKYLSRAKKESLTASQTFLPTLEQRLKSTVDVNTPVRLLKGLRKVDADGETNNEHPTDELEARKQKLWDEVKVSTFTRFIVGCYSVCILALIMQLQMHIINRLEMSEELNVVQEEEQCESLSKFRSAGSSVDVCKLTYEKRHRVMKATFEHLFGDGLRQLAAKTQCALKSMLSDWSVHSKTEVEFTEFESKLHDIKREIASSQAEFLGFIIPPAAPEGGEILVQKMLNETWDAIESPHFFVCMQQCLDVTIDSLCNSLKTVVFVNSTGCEAGSDDSLAKPPLGALIPQMKSCLNKIFKEDDSNIFLPEILYCPATMSFCSSIFDQPVQEI